MNALDGILENFDITTLATIENKLKPCNELWQRIDNCIENLNNAVEIYKKTGIPPKYNFESWETSEAVESTHRRLSSKENIIPNENASNENPRGRSRREATRNHIKKEKMSILKATGTTENDKMPAPSRPVLKRTKQKKKGSQLQIEEQLEEELQRVSECRDSVIIQDVAMPVIDLVESDNESKTETEEIMSAPTRSSSRNKQKINHNLPELDNKEEAVKDKTESRGSKQQKSQSKIKIKKEKSVEEPQKKVVQDLTMVMVNLVDSVSIENIQEENTTKNGSTKRKYKEAKKRTRRQSWSEGEDQNTEKKPKSDSENPRKSINNATFVSKSPFNGNLTTVLGSMNATVVVENPKFVANNNKMMIDDLMTEKRTPPRTVTKPVAKTVTKVPKPKVIQSEATVKKQMHPLEKINLEPSTCRVTRTKSKIQAKDQEAEAVELSEIFTPLPSKMLPKCAHSANKKNTHTPLSSVKYASELKASQAEYREREKKRREKEKKAEVLMRTHLEGKKKNREEKQAKVQKQREAYEQDKQKQKEELVNRKIEKIKALEEKKLQERQKRNEVVQKQPAYMTTKAPLLPTPDCYDSDDDSKDRKPIEEVVWARSVTLREMLRCMMAVGDTMKNTFFSRQLETADLQEIFEKIEPEKLKRSSSAIWKKPPRYTMMPVLDQHVEDSEDDD